MKLFIKFIISSIVIAVSKLSVNILYINYINQNTKNELANTSATSGAGVGVGFNAVFDILSVYLISTTLIIIIVTLIINRKEYYGKWFINSLIIFSISFIFQSVIYIFFVSPNITILAFASIFDLIALCIVNFICFRKFNNLNNIR